MKGKDMVNKSMAPIGLESLEFGRIIEYRDLISRLGRLDFSVYDSRGRLLVPSADEDPLLRIFLRSEAGGKAHAAFFKSAIEKASVRKGLSFFKGPMNQYHPFMPVQAGDVFLVFVGNAFYVSRKDVLDVESKGPVYGLSLPETRLWTQGIVLSKFTEISERCAIISRLFNFSMRDMYDKTVNSRRYRKTRTILDLLSEIEDAADEYELCNLLVDAILFLFAGDTVSLMVRNNDMFSPILTKGSAKGKVDGVALKSGHTAFSAAIEGHKTFVCTEAFELLRLGYPEDISSLYCFPVGGKNEPLGLLGIFNSHLPDEDIDTISLLCRFIGLLVKTSRSRKTYEKYVSDIAAIDFASLGKLALKNPDTLCETIVEISSRLANAEKVSLMLPEEQQGELLIKAAKGVSKWIAKNIRVRIGEGIAGRVYKEGQPLRTADIEQNPSAQKRSNYRTGSFVSLPLKIDDEAIGVLNLADRTDGGVFSEEDMKFLQHFASCAAIAIKGAEYYSKLQQMRTLSITDSLTGLFNRRYFDDRLFEELQRAIRYDSFFSLAIFDIDDFKLFNDSEGHLAGDGVLKAVADISRESVRSVDILARFGGEEFAIIMPRTEKEEAILVAERTRTNIKKFLSREWETFPRREITVSIGVAAFPCGAKDAKTLIRNADKALYKAKVSGKDRTLAWDEVSPSGGNSAFFRDQDKKRGFMEPP